jgi:hypothetical protein
MPAAPDLSYRGPQGPSEGNSFWRTGLQMRGRKAGLAQPGAGNGALPPADAPAPAPLEGKLVPRAEPVAQV